MTSNSACAFCVKCQQHSMFVEHWSVKLTGRACCKSMSPLCNVSLLVWEEQTAESCVPLSLSLQDQTAESRVPLSLSLQDQTAESHVPLSLSLCKIKQLSHMYPSLSLWKIKQLSHMYPSLSLQDQTAESHVLQAGAFLQASGAAGRHDPYSSPCSACCSILWTHSVQRSLPRPWVPT